MELPCRHIGGMTVWGVEVFPTTGHQELASNAFAAESISEERNPNDGGGRDMK